MRINRKIKVITMMATLVVNLCACTAQKEIEADVNNTDTHISESISQEMADDTDAESSDSLASDPVEEQEVPEQKDTTAAEEFAAVLKNQTEFYFTDKAPHNHAHSYYQNEGLLSELQYGYENNYDIVNFAVVELNGDGIPEVILEVPNYFGYIILHYKDNQIFGVGTTFNSFFHLKKNGLSMSMGGVESGSVNRVYFMGDTMFFDKYVERDYSRFYKEDMICDEAFWDQESDKFFQEEPLEWYAITDENINTQILENPQLDVKASEIPLKVKQRQKHLDSIIYLQDAKYYLQIKEDAEYREDAINYYNGCLEEMDKILVLCREHLDEDMVAELEKEQLLWQENFEQRLSDELSIYNLDRMEDFLETNQRYTYFVYGDIVFRRIIRLIDMYYDSEATTTEMWEAYAQIAQEYYDGQQAIFEDAVFEEGYLNGLYFVPKGSYLADVTKQTFLVHDLNGDGIEEFFIAKSNSNMDESTIYDVYTWKDKRLYRLMSDIGYRNGTCDIQEGGYVLSRYSGTAYDFGVDVLILPKNGIELKYIDGVFDRQKQINESYTSEYFRAKAPIHKRDAEKITREKYDDFLAQYQPAELTFIENTPETVELLKSGNLKQ